VVIKVLEPFELSEEVALLDDNHLVILGA